MAQSMPSLQSTSLQTNSIGDGVFCCSVLFLFWVVLGWSVWSWGRIFPAFLVSPVVLLGVDYQEKTKIPPSLSFNHATNASFSKYFDLIVSTVRDRRQFAVLAQWRLRSTSCRTLSGCRQSIKKNEAFFANRLKRYLWRDFVFSFMLYSRWPTGDNKKAGNYRPQDHPYPLFFKMCLRFLRSL